MEMEMAGEQIEAAAADKAHGAMPERRASWGQIMLWMLYTFVLVMLATFGAFWFLFIKK